MTDFTITQVDFDRLLDQNDEEQAVGDAANLLI